MSTETIPHPSETPSIAQGRWRIDPARSSVEFRTPTLWGLATVNGHFERYEGSLDMERSPAIELTTDAGSLNTNNSFRDRHLRSADFFDARTYADHRTLGMSHGMLGMIPTPSELILHCRLVPDAD